jgi:hypothetical protein
MGRKKVCFGREDYVCLTKDCPYMSECIQAVWEKKVSGMLQRSRMGKKKSEAVKGKTKARR